MTLPAPSIVRPKDLERLGAELVRLATTGVLDRASEDFAWLHQIGAATLEDGRVAAHPDWLACALPCRDVRDLVARTVLRDPLYRLHTDAMVSTVCADIGRSGRWRRLEELLAGPLSPLAPRIASLLDVPANGADEPGKWAEFDEHCWGRAGASETLFPLVVARLPELMSTPVFIHTVEPLLLRLVRAVAAGEGLRVAGDEVAECTELQRFGVPIWLRSVGEDSREVCLTLGTRVETTRAPSPDTSSVPFSLGVPQLAMQHSAVVTSGRLRIEPLWPAVDAPEPSHAFIGVEPGQRWPAEERGPLPADAPLRDLIGARRAGTGGSDAADAALWSLSEHSFYGVWLQLLLLEALDRELGDESLLLAAKEPSGAGPIRVYYRLRPTSRRVAVPSTLLLGPLDRVLTRVTAGLGIETVGLLGDGDGPWSRGLELLAQVGVAAQVADRWAMSGHVLDRLHGGGLMTGVLRRGKDLRERLHGRLDGLWAEVAGER